MHRIRYPLDYLTITTTSIECFIINLDDNFSHLFNWPIMLSYVSNYFRI